MHSTGIHFCLINFFKGQFNFVQKYKKFQMCVIYENFKYVHTIEIHHTEPSLDGLMIFPGAILSLEKT